MDQPWLIHCTYLDLYKWSTKTYYGDFQYYYNKYSKVNDNKPTLIVNKTLIQQDFPKLASAQPNSA